MLNVGLHTLLGLLHRRMPKQLVTPTVSHKRSLTCSHTLNRISLTSSFYLHTDIVVLVIGHATLMALGATVEGTQHFNHLSCTRQSREAKRQKGNQRDSEVERQVCGVQFSEVAKRVKYICSDARRQGRETWIKNDVKVRLFPDDRQADSCQWDWWSACVCPARALNVTSQGFLTKVSQNPREIFHVSVSDGVHGCTCTEEVKHSSIRRKTPIEAINLSAMRPCG